MARLSHGVEFGGYLIESVVGRGGMGVVYRALESRPERAVALKVVAPELAADADFRARFLREAQIAASIEHPHVVPVLRIGEEDGLLFIAMRLIPGRDLAELIQAERRLEPERAARLVDQVADALDTAHEQGLVHRDVKPANVLVEHRRRGEHVYLTDFGLTKSLAGSGALTSTGVIVGTTNYMAPEQWEGRRLDARVDVYSLGCVLFETLTGQVPYERDAQPARMYAHLSEPPPTVSALAPGAARFDEVIARALAKNPDDRFQSAGDLGYAAVAAAESRPVTRSERTVAAGEAAPMIAPLEAIRADQPGPTRVPPVTRPADRELSGPTTQPDPVATTRPVTKQSGRLSGHALALIILGVMAVAGVGAAMLAAGGTGTTGSAQSSSSGELGKVARELVAWHLDPAPLFPTRLPPVFQGASAVLDRQNVDFNVEWSGTHGGITTFAVAFRRGPSGLLGEVLSDRRNVSTRQLRIGARTVYSINSGKLTFAWVEGGRTYLLIDKYQNEQEAQALATAFIANLRPLR